MRALGPATRLTSMRRYVGSPVWTADGREILFLSGENSKGGQLWRLRVPETGAGPAQPQLEPAPVESRGLEFQNPV
jgi:Tol biopolymer transport system component